MYFVWVRFRACFGFVSLRATLAHVKDKYVQVHNLEIKNAKGNKGKSAPTASESLEAAKLAYKKVAQAADSAKACHLSWKCRGHVGRHVFPSFPVTLFWTTADMSLTL